jgi:hypothetical protein
MGSPLYKFSAPTMQKAGNREDTLSRKIETRALSPSRPFAFKFPYLVANHFFGRRRAWTPLACRAATKASASFSVPS